MMTKVEAFGVLFDVEHEKGEGVLQAFAGDDDQDVWELLTPNTQGEIEFQLSLVAEHEASARDAAAEDRWDAEREERRMTA